MSRPAPFRPRSVKDLLAADTSLARYAAQARRLAHLQQIFQSLTPLARHARIANIRDGNIIIHATNGSIATKLRQIERRLVVALQSSSFQVTGLVIRLQPDNPTSAATPARQNKTIGIDQKQALTSLAESLPEGSQLRTAVERLLSRVK